MLLSPHTDVITEEGMSDDDALVSELEPSDPSAGIAGSLRSSKHSKGVIYISRIPPHLKPQKMRQLLEQYGEVGRLYLAPEMPSLRAKRKKLKGNTGKNFTEGWVEFEDKCVAKSVARMLNGQQMGGKRRSAYHYDLWCLKYLPKFQWDSLTEEIAYQRAVHDQKLAAELSTAKRERDFYLSRIDKAKGIAAIKERRQQQAEVSSGAMEPSAAPSATTSATLAAGTAANSLASGRSATDSAPKRVRGFGQRKVKADSSSARGEPLPSSLLTLIAGI